MTAAGGRVCWRGRTAAQHAGVVARPFLPRGREGWGWKRGQGPWCGRRLLAVAALVLGTLSARGGAASRSSILANQAAGRVVEFTVVGRLGRSAPSEGEVHGEVYSVATNGSFAYIGLIHHSRQSISQTPLDRWKWAGWMALATQCEPWSSGMV